MSGRDLIGIAKTGSGKTIAFLLPMFRHIMDQRPLEESEGPICKDHIISFCFFLMFQHFPEYLMLVEEMFSSHAFFLYSLQL